MSVVRRALMTVLLPDLLRLEVPLGARVTVFADLHLEAATTPASVEACAQLEQAIGAWTGPGIVICNGGLLGGECDPDGSPADRVADVLAAHPKFFETLARFAAAPGRQLVILPGFRDPELAWSADARGLLATRLGATFALAVELAVCTGEEVRTVRVEPGDRFDPLAARRDPTNPGEMPLATHLRLHAGARTRAGEARGGAGETRVRGEARVGGEARGDGGWLAGLEALDDPAAAPRFLASRLAYRKLARRSWLLLLLLAPALAFRVPLLLVQRAQSGLSDATRLELAAAATLLEVVALLGLVGVAVRRTWAALVEVLPGRDSPDLNEPGRAAARDLIEAGAAGLITSHTARPELRLLGDGFYLNTGGAGQVVREVPGRFRRLGLPGVFLPSDQVGWIELEAGHQLHARLVYGARAMPGATWVERLAAASDPTVRRRADLRLEVVASYPHGESWPPAPQPERHRVLVRRVAAAAVAVAGFVSLISALSEPFRDRLHTVRDVVPIAVPEAAAALAALGAVGLLLLARGIRRGQRRAWLVCEALLVTIAALHIIKGVDVEEAAVALAAAWFLWVYREAFAAPSNPPPWRRGVTMVAGAAVVVLVAGTLGLEFGSWYSNEQHPLVHRVSWVRAFQASAERLVGVHHVPLPPRLADFFNPAMATVGVGLGVALCWLCLRPVAARRARLAARGGADTSARARAQAVLARHGAGTLDYFALRSDKEFFFWGDTLVAYGVYHGTCLVSPDPIGPATEAAEAWRQFRAFVDRHGWSLGVLGAGEAWLPIYRASGMHDLYVGDEGIVQVQGFSLQGGRFKGLRQAVNRVARYGYTISFHDPSEIEAPLRAGLEAVMTKSRRGEAERGFSMTLGRAFQPEDRGLLLAVVHGPPEHPDGPPGPPVAFCQYVPAPGIGGYSLDLMRRDDGEHPNGLIDYAVVETIRYLQQRGMRGLGLNFATMRAVLAGEVGDGLVTRVQAWLLRRMGDAMQIESLWRFNAKFDPEWLPRYAVYDTPEHALSTALAVARAESFWELPVVGRFLTPTAQSTPVGGG